MVEQLQNFGSTTLSSGIDDTTTTVSVVDGSVFPASGVFRINVEDELMQVTARSSNDLTVVRGTEGTTAASHSSGADVVAVLTAAGLSAAIDDAINAEFSGPDYVQFALDTEYPTYYWGNSATGYATALTLAPPTGAQGLIVMWACDYIGGSTSVHRLLSVTYGNQSMTLLNNLANTGGITYHHILDLSSAEDTVLRFTTTRYRAASIVVVWIVGPYTVSLTNSDADANATSPSALVTTTAGGTGVITGGFASTSMTVPASPGTVLKSAWNPSQGGQAGLTKNENVSPNSSLTVTQSYSGVGNMVSHSYSMAEVTPPTMNHHSDVDTTGVSDEELLKYDAAAAKWKPGTLAVDGLTDVSASGALDGDQLTFAAGTYTVGEADTGAAPTITAGSYTAGLPSYVWPGDAGTVRLWNQTGAGNWFQFDFGEGNTRRYARCDVTQFTHYSGYIRIASSVDGTNWTQVAFATPSGMSTVITFDDPSRLARYWRLYSVHGSGDAPGFSEVKFYHSVAGSDVWGPDAVVVPSSMSDLSDVASTSPSAGDIMQWVAGTAALGDVHGPVWGEDVSATHSTLVLGVGNALLPSYYGVVRMNTSSQWVRFDYGTNPQRFYKWEIDQGESGQYATRIVIEHSDDGSSWEVAADESGLIYQVTRTITMADPDSVRRYWRISTPAVSSSYAQMTEIRTYKAVSTDQWAPLAGLDSTGAQVGDSLVWGGSKWVPTSVYLTLPLFPVDAYIVSS